MFICKIKKQDSLAKRAKLLTSGITHLGGPARHSYKHFINIIKEINRKKTIAGLSRLGGLSHFARPARPCNKALNHKVQIYQSLCEDTQGRIVEICLYYGMY